MAKDSESGDGLIEKIAMIADAMENLFPNSRTATMFELKKKEYKMIQKHFREIDRSHKQFKIDMSGIEFVFILDE